MFKKGYTWIKKKILWFFLGGIALAAGADALLPVNPPGLVEVPDTTQVYDHDFYIANFTDPSRNNVVIHMEITKAQYDSGAHPNRPDLVWVNNETRQMMKSVPTVLKDGEYSIEKSSLMQIPGEVLPVTYRVKEAGKIEQTVSDLSTINSPTQ